MRFSEFLLEDNGLEFRRISNGVFDVYVDGKKTKYEIINGSRGLSGRNTQNLYIINDRTTHQRIKGGDGTLQKCKKSIKHWYSKGNVKPLIDKT